MSGKSVVCVIYSAIIRNYVHTHTHTHHSAMDKFKGLDKRAREGSEDVALNSTHQNAITQIALHSGTPDSATKFSTSGGDGRLVIWDCKSLEASIAGLKFQ